MHVERLTKLAELLENLHPSKFFIREWASGSSNGCGYAACAVGTACLDPWFNEQGLKFDDPLDTALAVFSEYEEAMGVKNRTLGLMPVYVEDEGWDAVCMFFEIAPDDADYLFSGERYQNFWSDKGKMRKIPPSEVAARIRSFISERGQR